MPKPPKHTYTPKQFTELIDEFIRKCKDENDDYVACPEQLYMHTGLSRSTISEYKSLESNKDYKDATLKAYNYIGIEGWKDLRDGNGRFGQNIVGRVLKYSETQEINTTNKTIVAEVDIDKMTETEADKILKDIL